MKCEFKFETYLLARTKWKKKKKIEQKFSSAGDHWKRISIRIYGKKFICDINENMIFHNWRAFQWNRIPPFDDAISKQYSYVYKPTCIGLLQCAVSVFYSLLVSVESALSQKHLISRLNCILLNVITNKMKRNEIFSFIYKSNNQVWNGPALSYYNDT